MRQAVMNRDITRFVATLQAINTLCYVAANAIILFGHCLWYAPSVLWLGFIRWEVGVSTLFLVSPCNSSCCTFKLIQPTRN